MAVVLKGVARMQDRINMQMARMGVVTMAGLIEASIIIRRSTEDSSPITPLDTGNLRASWFTVTPRGPSSGKSPSFEGENAGDMKKNHSAALSEYGTTVKTRRVPTVGLGFSANYAGFVHEMVDAQNWSRPGSGAWYLASSIQSTKPAVLAAIYKHAKFKK